MPRGRFHVRFHDKEIDPSFDGIFGDEKTFNALTRLPTHFQCIDDAGQFG